VWDKRREKRRRIMAQDESLTYPDFVAKIEASGNQYDLEIVINAEQVVQTIVEENVIDPKDSSTIREQIEEYIETLPTPHDKELATQAMLLMVQDLLAGVQKPDTQ
jgi:hypothetical protein